MVEYIHTLSFKTVGKSFEELSDVLVKQFHIESGGCLDLASWARKWETPSCRISRATCRRHPTSSSQRILKLLWYFDETLFYFIRGFRDYLRSYVILQRPRSFADADMLSEGAFMSNRNMLVKGESPTNLVNCCLANKNLLIKSARTFLSVWDKLLNWF